MRRSCEDCEVVVRKRQDKPLRLGGVRVKSPESKPRHEVSRRKLSALCSAQSLQGRDDLPRPLVDFIFAQGTLVGLESCSQQNRVASGGDGTSTEDFDGHKAA